MQLPSGGRLEKPLLVMVQTGVMLWRTLYGRSQGCDLQTVDADHRNKVPQQRIVCMDGVCEVLGIMVGW
jgi:hypothetical protein